MNRFANTTSFALLSLGFSMAAAGCVAASPDDADALSEVAQADQGQNLGPAPAYGVYQAPANSGFFGYPATLPSNAYPAPLNGGYASPPSFAYPAPPTGVFQPPQMTPWPGSWNWTPPGGGYNPVPPSGGYYPPAPGGSAAPPGVGYQPPCSGFGPYPVAGGCS